MRSRAGSRPVLASIYDEPAFEKAYPFHQLIKDQLENYGIRPQTPEYQDVTLAIQDTLQTRRSDRPEQHRQQVGRRDRDSHQGRLAVK